MFKTFLIIVLATIFGSACSGFPKRNPVPEEFILDAQIPGIPYARYWGDDSESALNSLFWEENLDVTTLDNFYDVEHNYLAISGGGPRGAFGAGFLNGWTAAGTRPEFAFVTGVSTGALIAPLAYLGSDYDHILEKVYTGISTEDIIEMRSLYEMVTLDGVADSMPLRHLVETHINEELVQAISRRYATGPNLVILTTNLDVGRPVVWNIGAIASSGHPDALRLIQDILIASASVPAVFPPVVFEVEADGKRFDEMHVDGGATSQVHLYPLELDVVSATKLYKIKGVPRAYIIRNGFVEGQYDPIKRSTLAIATASMGTLMQNISYGDIYRIYLETLRDGIEFNLAYVPDTFNEPSNEPFDNAYMKKLYQLGYDLAANGYEWKSAPHDYLLD